MFKISAFLCISSLLSLPHIVYAGDWNTSQQASIANQAFHDFRKAYIKNGSDGLAEQVMDCYDTNLKILMEMKDNRTLEERIRHSDALKACYLEDETAIQSFSSRMKCFKRGKTDYFSEDKLEVKERQTIYGHLLFNHSPIDKSDDDYLVEFFPFTVSFHIGKIIPCMEDYYSNRHFN